MILIAPLNQKSHRDWKVHRESVTMLGVIWKWELFPLCGKKKKKEGYYTPWTFSAEKNNFRRHKEHPKWRTEEGCGAF